MLVPQAMGTSAAQGNSSRIDHTLFRCISDNLWGGRRGNGKGVSLDLERDIDLGNLYFFFHSKVD